MRWEHKGANLQDPISLVNSKKLLPEMPKSFSRAPTAEGNLRDAYIVNHNSLGIRISVPAHLSWLFPSSFCLLSFVHNLIHKTYLKLCCWQLQSFKKKKIMNGILLRENDIISQFQKVCLMKKAFSTEIKLPLTLLYIWKLQEWLFKSNIIHLPEKHRTNHSVIKPDSISWNKIISS